MTLKPLFLAVVAGIALSVTSLTQAPRSAEARIVPMPVVTVQSESDPAALPTSDPVMQLDPRAWCWGPQFQVADDVRCTIYLRERDSGSRTVEGREVKWSAADVW